MHYIGLGKRPEDPSALDYEGLSKRKSALNYIGLGKKSSALEAERQRYADMIHRVSKRGGRRVQLSRRWTSSTVDPALLVMGIGRK